jgi:hypothetical protein
MPAVVSTSAVYANNNPEPCPATFAKSYVALEPLPYSFSVSMGQPLLSGGVLPRGQRVWLQQAIMRSETAPVVQAFVAGTGFVSVDPRLLGRADGLPNR